MKKYAAQIGDIIAQVSQSSKNREYYRIGRISNVNYVSKNTQIVQVKYGYYYPLSKEKVKWKINKPLNCTMKSALINEEIESEILDVYLKWEASLLEQLENESSQIISFMKNIYENETSDVAIYYDEGDYYVIKNGDGRESLKGVSRLQYEHIRDKGYLNGNRLLTYKNRKIYPFKYPEDEMKRDNTIHDFMAFAQRLKV